jgi:hypothetical protein
VGVGPGEIVEVDVDLALAVERDRTRETVPADAIVLAIDQIFSLAAVIKPPMLPTLADINRLFFDARYCARMSMVISCEPIAKIVFSISSGRR